MTLSLTTNGTLKWLSSLPILMQESFWWWQCSDRYISLSLPPFSPSLISLTVSVDVMHHVYFMSVRQSSGSLWKSRWTSWAPVPNKPTRFCGRKATLQPMSVHAKRPLTHVKDPVVRVRLVDYGNFLNLSNCSIRCEDVEDVPLLEFMYLACQVRVTVGDSGLCCCTRVTSFER